MQRVVSPAIKYSVLIVEDEFITSNVIARQLRSKGYQISGEVVSYDEAVACYQESSPDLAVLDVRLSGARSGIDFAHYLRRQPDPIPFVYLTAQLNPANRSRCMDTFPAGYLNKPLHMESLLTTIETALHNHYQQDNGEVVHIHSSQSVHKIAVHDILHLQADHVYVNVLLRDGKTIMLRRSLSDLIADINHADIVQIHRSHAVNLRHVTGYNRRQLTVGEEEIPISNTYRDGVMNRVLPDD